MAEGISGISAAAGNTQSRTSRVGELTVKSGETLSAIAKRYGMTPKEFMDWTGLKSQNLQAGQKIKLPTDTVPEGKGLVALARKYGMSLDEFCKLNKISKEYKPSKGEVFYIKNNKANTNNSSETSNQSRTSGTPAKTRQTTPPDKTTASTAPQSSTTPAAENQKKWGAPFTPEEIAAFLEKEADNRWGAVGKKSFDDMLAQINPKNASAVIQAYNKGNYGQTLINRITHEVMSKEQNRKDAVMHIYDALAAEKNIPADKRQEFLNELNARFDDWGMVDTKKLDSMLEDIISGKIKSQSPVSNSGKSTSSSAVSSDGRTVKLTKKDKSFTVSELQRGAISSAKKEALENFKEYCKANNIKFDADMLDMAPLERIPAPTIKGSSIVAKESEVLKPTVKPNGKIVILNPGHGGYSSRTGYFDPGSYSFIKKGNGKYAPLLEYDKMARYADSTAERLQAQGYTVVITSAHAQTLSDQKSISKLVSELNSGAKDGNKYNNNNILFISLHADSEPGKSGSGVCYDSRFSNDTQLTNTLVSNLNQDDWISAGSSERNWNVKGKGLQVLHQTEQIPSVLIEVEYVNGSKAKNLDSSAFQNRFETRLIDGINEYFKIK